jgi:predicted nucleotidyltransferase component of viral defense system
MILFDEIRRNFTENIHIEKNSRDMIKEALQYKALEIIFSRKEQNGFVFIGGTCLRIFYGIKRFSEDLDFDLLPGNKYELNDHEKLLKLLTKKFQKEGYDVESSCKETARNVLTGQLKFPGLEYRLKTKNNPGDVIKLKIEVQPQGYTYTPEKKLINKFGVFNTVNVMPVDLLFASKLFTTIERKKGRDFYDVIELSSFAKADERFLKYRAEKNGHKYESPNDIKKLILENISNVDWKEKVNEVGLFLFDKLDVKKIAQFPLWLEQTDFNKIVNQNIKYQ